MRGSNRERVVTALVVVALVAAACSGGDDGESSEPGSDAEAVGGETFDPYPGYESERYADGSMWLCRPGIDRNYCTDDLDATEILPDGSRQVVEHEAAEAPEFDCFYVYPTVDLSGAPGNHTDFSEVDLELDPLYSQAARFTSLCRVFAPLYRQVTIATFGSDDSEQFLDLAYGDVLDAFKHYMAQDNDGRAFVLMGHSQGSGMLTRLVEEELDDSPELRERLISALLIGTGGVFVPEGEVVGGTFANVPLCTSGDETGCVVAYTSFSTTSPPPPEGGIAGEAPAGMVNACTNPAALTGGKARLSGAYLPLSVRQPMFANAMSSAPQGVETPFILYPDAYTAECVTSETEPGVAHLAIVVEPAPDDGRDVPTLVDPVIEALGLGLHLADWNLAMDDLLDLVARQAAAIDRSV